MIKVIDNFLSPDECSEYIELIEEFTRQKNIPFTNSSTNFNHKYVNEELSQKFYERFLTFKDDSLNVVKPNNLIMMAKYANGEQFGIHTDTGLYYNKDKQLKTQYTVLIYLNDDFEGGLTIFYDDFFNKTTEIIPRKGSCLIFDINLWHEGQIVKSGNKYWIGCEFIGKFT